MTTRYARRVYLTIYRDDFQPGDPPPTGYMEWHNWARTQYRAGLRQLQCIGCGRWLFPQEVRQHECAGSQARR